MKEVNLTEQCGRLLKPDVTRALKWLGRGGAITLLIAAGTVPEIAFADAEPPVGFTCPAVEGTVYTPGNVRSIVGKGGVCQPPEVVPAP